MHRNTFFQCIYSVGQKYLKYKLTGKASLIHSRFFHVTAEWKQYREDGVCSRGWRRAAAVLGGHCNGKVLPVSVIWTFFLFNHPGTEISWLRQSWVILLFQKSWNLKTSKGKPSPLSSQRAGIPSPPPTQGSVQGPQAFLRKLDNSRFTGLRCNI